MNSVVRNFWTLSLSILGFLNGLCAQDHVIINDSIYSESLKEQRSLKISLPEKYNPDSVAKYDVAYLIDGEWNLDLFSFIADFTKGENYIPSMILVAIPNTYIDGVNMRDRDFLPEKMMGNPRAGGGDHFLAFLKNELRPYIDKKYHTSGNNFLYGHSYGGLFTMYTLLKEPGLFNAYFCSDPSFFWNNHFMVNLAKKTFASGSDLNKTLWVNGREDAFVAMSIQKMDSLLQVDAPKNLRWKVSVYPNETHNSVRFKGIYDGLKFYYDGYPGSALLFHPMNGILLKDQPMRVFISSSSSNVRYTTDGSEPDLSSKLTGSMFDISSPATLNLKKFSGNTRYVSTAKGTFKQGEVFRSLKKPAGIKNGGLRYSYFEGSWDAMPDFLKLKPAKTGIADSTFKLSEIGPQTDFACMFEGYIEIEQDGYYIFAIGANKGARLFLNHKLLVEDYDMKSEDDIQSFNIPLQKGFYPVRIEFFQKGGNPMLQLYYLLPGSLQAQTLPYKLQYY
ncbi:MAG: alpha/beta hydrolase-fold protein [Bacteroidales bacterium]|nr:alpha/beta hydrolase-fold protein [Bacteroidales bacterium]